MTHQNPKPLAVTAIIVTYRSADLTIGCLHSLVSERNDPTLDLRVVVVDNASGDGPAIKSEIDAQNWSSWVRLVEAPRNGGFAYGNNVGFAWGLKDGNPDYFHLLNPDTLIKPGAVRILAEFLNAHPAAGIAGSSFENGDGSDWPIAFRFPSLMSEVEQGLKLGVVSKLLKKWVVPRTMSNLNEQIDWCAGASMMVRRELIEKIGGMDQSFFLYYEETEFCWRAKQIGFENWYVPASRVMHIAGQSTKVTERDAAPKRLPAYLFESRRRYFQLTLGTCKAIAVDLAALLACSLGRAKSRLQGRQDQDIPHYIADLWQHSLIHRKNRDCAPQQTTPEIPLEN